MFVARSKVIYEEEGSIVARGGRKVKRTSLTKEDVKVKRTSSLKGQRKVTTGKATRRTERITREERGSSSLAQEFGLD